MKIRPLHDWAVIKRVPAEEKTSGGIIIPEMAKEKPADGVIVSIGPGKLVPEKGKGKEKDKKKVFVPTVLQPGQRVVFVDYMAKDFEIDGVEITMIQEEYVLGINEEPAVSQIVVKKEHPVAAKKEHPVTVKKVHHPAVQAKPSEPAKKEEKKMPARPAQKKKAAAKKASAKKPAKKAASAKKALKPAKPKKAGPKKASVKPKAKKTLVKKKTAPSKKTKKK